MQKIIFVFGITGAGKSSIARLIAKRANFMLIDQDIVSVNYNEFIMGNYSQSKDPFDRESQYYKEMIRPIEYKTMLKLAIDNLQNGQSVVIAADFDEEIQHNTYLTENEYMKAILEMATLYAVHVTVDHATLLNRLIHRNAEKDRWKIDNWQSYLKSVDEMKVTWPNHYTYIHFDNSDSLPILYEIKVKNLMNSI